MKSASFPLIRSPHISLERYTHHIRTYIYLLTETSKGTVEAEFVRQFVPVVDSRTRNEKCCIQEFPLRRLCAMPIRYEFLEKHLNLETPKASVTVLLDIRRPAAGLCPYISSNLEVSLWRPCAGAMEPRGRLEWP